MLTLTESAVTLTRTFLGPGCVKWSNGIDYAPKAGTQGHNHKNGLGGTTRRGSVELNWTGSGETGEFTQEKRLRRRNSEALGYMWETDWAISPRKGQPLPFSAAGILHGSRIGTPPCLAGGGEWGMLLSQEAEGLRRRGFRQEAKPPSSEGKQTEEKRTMGSSAIFLIVESLFLYIEYKYIHIAYKYIQYMQYSL